MDFTTTRQGRKNIVHDFNKHFKMHEILIMIRDSLLSVNYSSTVMLKSREVLSGRCKGYRFHFSLRSARGGNIVCEMPSFIATRSKYLSLIRELSMEGNDIMFYDKTWGNAHHAHEEECNS